MKMEDDLNFLKGRRPQFLLKEDDLKQLKVKTIIFLIMEDDLNFFLGRRPQKNNATQNN